MSLMKWVDHRMIPVEVLREFAMHQAELTSIRLAAEDAGVGRSTLHKFIAQGSMPHARIRRLLALWYIRRVEGLELAEYARPYVAAFENLFSGLPEPSIRRVLDTIAEEFAAAERETPRWIAVIRTRLEESRPVQ